MLDIFCNVFAADESYKVELDDFMFILELPESLGVLADGL